MKIGITCYPTYGGSGAVATELGIVLEDQDRWGRFSAADRADAVSRFSSDRVVPMYEALYRDVLNREFEG